MSADENLDDNDLPALREADRKAAVWAGEKETESFEAKASNAGEGKSIQASPHRSSAGAPLTPEGAVRRWRIVARADDPDPDRANRQILTDLENRADGIALVFEGAPNAFGYGLSADENALAVLLRDVPLDRIYLRADAHPGNRTTTERLLAHLSRQRINPQRLDLSFGIDPASVFAGTGRLRMSLEALEASMPQSLAHFFTLGVPAILLEADGRVFHNAGATEAQEIGMMLASVVSYLRLFERARQPLVYAVPHIGFCLSVDQDLATGMAKIRTLRTLWGRVLESCSLPPSPVRIHAETSWRMLAARDAQTNISRNSIACLAAAAADADSVTVLPHTLALGLPDAEARRLACNTQLVLAEESRIGLRAEPARGSSVVEALALDLGDAAWTEFRRIEGEGGALRSLAAGLIQARIAQAQAERAAQFASGRRGIVGAAIFPTAEEQPANTLPAEIRPMPAEGAVFCQKLELLRDEYLPAIAEVAVLETGRLDGGAALVT